MDYYCFLIILLFVLVVLSHIKGNTANLENIEKSGIDENTVTGKTLIFYAPWCGYCKAGMEEFKKAQESSNGNIILVNGDSNPNLVKKYNITGYPTIIKNSVVYRGENESSKILKFANT